MFFYNALCAIEGGQFNRTPTTRLIQASCASPLFQTHFNIPFMLLPPSILFFEIQLFCISACLFKYCHTSSHYEFPFMPLSMFVSLYFSAFRLWTSLICLYICTSMCLYDCMCVFLYCCVPPFFQTTSKSHSCFRQLGKIKFRPLEFGTIHVTNL